MSKSRHLNPIFPVRLSAEHLALLDRLATSLGVSRTDIVRMALIEFAGKFTVAKRKKAE